MKHLRIMWIVAGLWSAFCVYQGVSMFKIAWSHESSVLEWGEKIKLYLAGVGTFTVGGGPLFVTWMLHKFHKSRERGRLLKEKRRIETRLRKLDERTAGVAAPRSGRTESGQETPVAGPGRG